MRCQEWWQPISAGWAGVGIKTTLKLVLAGAVEKSQMAGGLDSDWLVVRHSDKQKVGVL